MKKLLLALALFLALPVSAQIVPAQNQLIVPPYGGYLVATSSSGTSKVSATTSPYFATSTISNLTVGTCTGCDFGSSNWSYNGVRLTPTSTTAGILVNASSTIGGGSTTTGLTINGGSTTTLGAYFASRVGIGTNVPSQLLTVHGGSILVGQSEASRAVYFFNTNYGVTANSGLELFTADHIRFREGSTERMRIEQTSGDVGIATTAPKYRLDTYNTDGARIARFKDTDSTQEGIVISGDTNGGYIGNSDISSTLGETIYFQNSTNLQRFYVAGTDEVRLSSTAFAPSTSGGNDLGTSALQWGSLIAGLSSTTRASSTVSSTTNQSLYGRLFDGTNSAGTNGSVLLTTGNGVVWTPTSSLGISGGSGDGVSNWSYNGTRVTPTTTTAGMVVNASSSIGDGTQTGGLNINGGGTTTLNHIVLQRLGIGSTTPTEVISVSTTTTANLLARFTNPATSGFIGIVGGGTGWGFGTASMNPLQFYAGNTEYLRLSQTGGLSLGSTFVSTNPGAGNAIFQGVVGIGTSTPNVSLDVVNPNSPTSIVVGSQEAGKTYGIFQTSGDTAGYFNLQSIRSSGSAFGDMVFNRDGGNVGVGIINPANKLDVNGSASLATSGFLGFVGNTVVDTSNYSLFGNTTLTLLNARSGGSIGFRIANADVANFTTTGGFGFGNTYYNIDPGQNNMNVEGTVGIGTTTPSQKLTVAGGFHLTGGMYDRTASPGTNGMVLQTTGTGVQWVATSSLGITGTASDWRKNTAGDAITPTTTVGIGIFASSTIGGGNGTNGLTINGKGTTTSDHFVGGKVISSSASTTNSSSTRITNYQQYYDTNSTAGTSGQVLTSTGTSTLWKTSSSGGTASTSIITFTASGTWTKPSGLVYAIVEIQAAGGDSGTTALTNNGGGGAGCYAQFIFNASDLSSTETVTVGTAGIGTGSTSFKTASCLNGTDGSGRTGGTGGVATSGVMFINGQDGYTTLNSTTQGGDGGGSFWGNGGIGGASSLNTSTALNAGTCSGYGSGGGAGGVATDSNPKGNDTPGCAGAVKVTMVLSL